MLRLLFSKIESNLPMVPGLRLCMAASSHAQRNKQAGATKRLQLKTISRIAQIIEARIANAGAIIFVCCPISLKQLGKF
jgi:hypothetical protein